MKMLSIQRPLPSMLTCAPAASTASIQASLVNWQPWSVLKMSGAQPATSRASSNASKQNEVSRVLEILQLSTARVCQSMIATR